MVIAIIVMLALMALMMMALYAMLVVASRADERAEKMARTWAEEHSKRVNEIVDNLKADVISADKILVKEKDDGKAVQSADE